MGSASSQPDTTLSKARVSVKKTNSERGTKQRQNDTEHLEDIREEAEVVGEDNHVTESDHDDWSIDSKDSDDTLGLFRRMRRYVPNYDDTDSDDENVETVQIYENELIDIIAKENLVVYDSSGNQCNNIDSPQTKRSNNETYNENDGDDDSTPDDTPREPKSQDPEAFEAGTIGYYIAIADNDAKGINEKHNKEGQPISKDYISQFLDERQNGYRSDTPEEKHINHAKKSFESVKRIYGNKAKPIPKIVSNRQTLVMVKINSQYKYVAVPAYLPGQKVYRAKSIPSKHKRGKSYIAPYTKGKMASTLSVRHM